MKFTDYKNSLVNLSNSILKKYNCTTFHPSISKIDDLIQKHNKIAVILMDGMGTYLLDAHKDVATNFNKHRFMQITSVYPPTTVAATTSFLTAKYPGETGFLGWSQPINNFQRNVNVFTNCDTQTGEKIPGPNIINELCPNKKIIHLINEKCNKRIAYDIYRYPVDKKGPKSFPSFLRRIRKTSKNLDEFFIYGYFNNPDHTIHTNGTDGKRVKKVIKNYTKRIVRFAAKNKDMLVIVIADHGLIDIRPLFIDEHQDLKALLQCPFSLEVRTPNFKIKEGQSELFEQLFNKYYGDHFKLYKKEDLNKIKLFTDNKISDTALQFIGDYVAVAKDESALIFENTAPFKAHHAGPSEKEMDISITVFNEVK